MPDSQVISFELEQIQKAIADFGFDGWLLYDFRGLNVLAIRVLKIPESGIGSRRFFYFIPAEGEPQKLVHRIEESALDHLPGEKHVYLTWQQLHEGIETIIGDAKRIAMEYSPNNSNPYVSRVDAGTIELVRSFGVDVQSSGNLIQFFEARWTEQQWQLHLQADELNRLDLRAIQMRHCRAGVVIHIGDGQLNSITDFAGFDQSGNRRQFGNRRQSGNRRGWRSIGGITWDVKGGNATEKTIQARVDL